MNTIFALTLVVAQVPAGQTKTEIHPTDQNIVKYVLQDLLSIEENDRPFVRYLAAPPRPRPEWIHASNYVVNSAPSKSRNLEIGTVIAGGYLIRYDLRDLAPRKADLIKLLRRWDALSFRDPYYHVNLETADVDLTDFAKLTGSAITAPHVDKIAANLAIDLNFSPSIAYRFDFFQDQVFQASETTLGPGLYYEFLDIPRGSSRTVRYRGRNGRYYTRREGRSDLDELLATLGIDYQQVKDLGGERRVGMFTSRVTSRARRGDTFVGNAGQRIWITNDPAEENVSANAHPIYSVVEMDDDAKEIIWQLTNGLHGYYIADGNGNRVNGVPINIASDTTIPDPFFRELTPGISCARCHALQDHAGLKPMPNDVRNLLSKGLVFLVDVNDIDQRDAFDNIELLYDGTDFQRSLDRGRIDLEATMVELVGNPNIPAKVSPFSLVINEVSQIWMDYRYTFIDARRALGELTGLWLDDNQKAVDTLHDVLGLQEGGIADPSIAQLLVGGTITRKDMERIYTSMALQIQLTSERENP